MNFDVKLFAAAAIALSVTVHGTHASDATWNLNPIDNNWNNAANWTPAIVPDGQATFDLSNMTDVSEVPTASVGSILFNPGASAFTISSQDLSITGLGVINNSSVTQNFVAVSCGANCFPINFIGSATVSGLVSFTTGPSSDFNLDLVAFKDNSSAGDGNYHAEGGVLGQPLGGAIYFFDSSTAGNGTFVIDGATVEGTNPALIQFRDTSSAGDAVITGNGSTIAGDGGGIISFSANRQDNPSLGNATLICYGGVNGGNGATISFNTFGYNRHENTSTASVKLYGNGTMNVIGAGPSGVDIGSLEGDGIVLLGRRRLRVGRNNVDTTFSGLISDNGDDSNFHPPISGTNLVPAGGRLNKTGTGTLTLTGANTYTGGTTVETGTLVISNRTGSGTGTGTVRVNTGMLSGLGTIAGPVIIGTGSGAGAILSPGKAAKKTAVFVLLSELTFKHDGIYRCGLNSDIASSDEVFVNGITINRGARFHLSDAGTLKLTPGLVLTVINNTAATPISGTFANLADGSTIAVGQNAFQVSYSGGDGNDLTLTVVP